MALRTSVLLADLMPNVLTPAAAYASSKAALVNLSEALRLELSPFGVSVLTVLVGTVDSHFHANDTALDGTGFKLPPSSRYAAIEDIIAGWASGESKPKGIAAEQLAEQLVGDLVGDGKSGLVWKGPNAGAIKFATKWFPDSLMVSWTGTVHFILHQGT